MPVATATFQPILGPMPQNPWPEDRAIPQPAFQPASEPVFQPGDQPGPQPAQVRPRMPTNTHPSCGNQIGSVPIRPPPGLLSASTSREPPPPPRLPSGSQFPEDRPPTALTRQTQPDYGPQSAIHDGDVRTEQQGVQEVLRGIMAVGNSFTDQALQHGLPVVVAEIDRIAKRQADIEAKFAEQSRWNREVKEDVEQQRLVVCLGAVLRPIDGMLTSRQIQAQQSFLLDEHNRAVVRSIEYDEYQGFREIENEDDDEFDSGPEYEAPDDRTFDPSLLSDSEEEYELIRPSVEEDDRDDRAPGPTTAARKRRARAQGTTRQNPSKRRPPWVRRETAVPNPHLARIARDIAQSRGARSRGGRGAGTISDPVRLD